MTTPMPDNSYSTLTQIKTKIRRLTRSPSTSQLTDDDLNQYINTFVLYDFPEHLRLFNLRSNLTFFTQPYIDTYETNTTDPSDPLYNFVNKYITVQQPVYIAGYQALFLESQSQFYAIYPKLNSIQSIGTAGDGATTTFTGVVNSAQSNILGVNGQTICLLQNNVLFSSLDSDSNGIALIDYPVSSTLGAFGVPDTPQVLPSPYGQINYLTGAFTVNFPVAPGSGQPINSQTVPQNPSLPQSILFYDGKFVVRPVPDQPYRIEIEALMRPSELLASDQSPELAEWWQYIAYGAAKKVFEDRMDMESVQMIAPEFHKQMLLINRRTIVQQTSQRTSTIYTEDTGTSGAYGPGLFNGGSQN